MYEVDGDTISWTTICGGDGVRIQRRILVGALLFTKLASRTDRKFTLTDSAQFLREQAKSRKMLNFMETNVA